MTDDQIPFRLAQTESLGTFADDAVDLLDQIPHAPLFDQVQVESVHHPHHLDPRRSHRHVMPTIVRGQSLDPVPIQKRPDRVAGVRKRLDAAASEQLLRFVVETQIIEMTPEPSILHRGREIDVLSIDVSRSILDHRVPEILNVICNREILRRPEPDAELEVEQRRQMPQKPFRLGRVVPPVVENPLRGEDDRMSMFRHVVERRLDVLGECFLVRTPQKADEMLVLRGSSRNRRRRRVPPSFFGQCPPIGVQAVLQRRGTGLGRAAVEDQPPFPVTHPGSRNEPPGEDLFRRGRHSCHGLPREMPLVHIEEHALSATADGRIDPLHRCIEGVVARTGRRDQAERVEVPVIVDDVQVLFRTKRARVLLIVAREVPVGGQVGEGDPFR